MHLRLLVPLMIVAIAVVMVGQRAMVDASADAAGAAAAQSAPVPKSARVEGSRLVIDGPAGSTDFVAGVNVGATIPGHQPGELAVRAEDYRRWFAKMHELGIGVIRIYTIQMPRFYEELRRHNLAHPDAPIGVLHGVWIPEEALYETRDVYAPAVRDGFAEEITDAVAAAHGSTTILPQPGHASGRYRADIGPWLLGWVIGIEWDPEVIRDSDRANGDAPAYRGTHFRAVRGATPTESWLAQMLDHTATEQARHGRQVPLSFTNWVTTDPLPHPEEPNATEDLVSIDANHVKPTRRWTGGYFASYHAYPYYPDFLRYEPALRGPDGTGDPYAGYLRLLREHHKGLPVVIAEFGVPSGAGIAHRGPLGRDQGDHSEQEAMRLNAEMLHIIHDAGLAGGLVFEWTDEWFKLTWNTIEQELPPERRAQWFNAWTNESQFGLLAARPGPRPIVTVDGDGGEWDRDRATVLHRSDEGPVRELLALHDAGFMYLLMTVDHPRTWRRTGVTLGFDLLDGGAHLPGVTLGPRTADTALQIGPRRSARLLTRASNNHYLIQYGVVRDYVDGVTVEDVAPASDRWDVQHLILNRPTRVPSTGAVHGTEHIAIGDLRAGTTDPDDARYDARNMWVARGRTIELRLPWMGVGLSDPSSRRALHVSADGTVRDVATAGVGVTIASDGRPTPAGRFTWQPWDLPSWHERPKRGLGVFTDALAAVAKTDSAERGATSRPRT